MGLKPYVGDGQLKTFYIAPIPNLTPAVRVKARRMGAYTSSASFADAASAGDGERHVQSQMNDVAQRIKSIEYFDDEAVNQAGDPEPKWKPIDDETGRPLVANSDATLKGLEPKLWWRIRDIIYGGEAADVDPETGVQQPSQEDQIKN